MNIVNYALRILEPKAKAFEKATEDPARAQEKILLEFLDRNRRTDYGKKHGFEKIKTVDEYRTTVPLTNYESLRPLIERMTRGEQNILTSDRPTLFGLTSGSCGQPKYIPVTKYSRSKKSSVMDIWIYYILRDHPKLLNGKILAIVSPEVEGRTPSGIPYGAESGHAYKNMPEAIRSRYVLPYCVFEIKDYDARYYSMLRIALEKKITSVAAMNPSTIVLLCQKIEALKDNMIEDIEKGVLKKDLGISPDCRRIIEKTLKPNPGRAAELKDILKKRKKLLPKYIWPEMEIIECWKGGTVGLYLREFPKYFGDVPIREFGYLSSEMRGSIAKSDIGAGGVLAINSNFYEFIPREDICKNESKTLLCNELEENGEYLIIATTPGGLYRYDIDDIVRVTGFFNKTPVIEFMQKGRNVASVTGEKLYECHVVEAVQKATNRHNLFIKFFTALIQWGDIPRYVFLAEFAKKPPHHKKKELLESIEEELCYINVEYQSKRASQRLNHPVLKIVQNGDFERYRAKRVKEGMHDGQFKVPQLVLDLDFQKHFTIEEIISIE